MSHSLMFRLLATGLTTLALMTPALSQAAGDEAVMTVMQFSAKSPAVVPELKKRMLAIRDFQRAKPGYIENNLYENRNPKISPQYVGVARWKSIKDWEALWLDAKFQKMVADVTEVGDINPGVFSAAK